VTLVGDVVVCSFEFYLCRYVSQFDSSIVALMDSRLYVHIAEH
jgi:hypothetical protein